MGVGTKFSPKVSRNALGPVSIRRPSPAASSWQVRASLGEDLMSAPESGSAGGTGLRSGTKPSPQGAHDNLHVQVVAMPAGRLGSWRSLPTDWGGGGLPEGCWTPESQLPSSRPLSGATRAAPGGVACPEAEGNQNALHRAGAAEEPPLQEGETPHSTPMGQPLPRSAPARGTRAQPGPLTFFEHSVSLLSPLAGPDLPLGARRAMFPLSSLSLREGS